MEQQLSDILDNILGLLLLEGSYEVEETEDSFSVAIETKDAGRLIGARGESLDSLQQLINQIMFQKVKQSGGSVEELKRVILDVANWRKQKEEDLYKSAQDWGKRVLETKEPMELEPQSAWQRRIVHMGIGEMEGLETESVGEGRDRHIVIKVKSQKSKVKSKKDTSEAKSAEGDKSEES